MKRTVTESTTGPTVSSPSATTRDPSFRFENGQFAMIGLIDNGRPLLRAYSMASPNHDEGLEFLLDQSAERAADVQAPAHQGRRQGAGGPQADRDGWCRRALLPGRNLYLVSTGTGFRAFRQHPARFRYLRALRKDRRHPWLPARWRRLGYSKRIVDDVLNGEFFAEAAAGKLHTTRPSTRENFENMGA